MFQKMVRKLLMATYYFIPVEAASEIDEAFWTAFTIRTVLQQRMSKRKKLKEIKKIIDEAHVKYMAAKKIIERETKHLNAGK